MEEVISRAILLELDSAYQCTGDSWLYYYNYVMVGFPDDV